MVVLSLIDLVYGLWLAFGSHAFPVSYYTPFVKLITFVSKFLSQRICHWHWDWLFANVLVVEVFNEQLIINLINLDTRFSFVMVSKDQWSSHITNFVYLLVNSIDCRFNQLSFNFPYDLFRCKLVNHWYDKLTFIWKTNFQNEYNGSQYNIPLYTKLVFGPIMLFQLFMSCFADRMPDEYKRIDSKVSIQVFNIPKYQFRFT